MTSGGAGFRHGRAGGNAFEVGVGVCAATAAAFDHGVNDGSPFSRHRPLKASSSFQVLLAEWRFRPGYYRSPPVNRL